MQQLDRWMQAGAILSLSFNDAAWLRSKDLITTGTLNTLNGPYGTGIKNGGFAWSSSIANIRTIPRTSPTAITTYTYLAWIYPTSVTMANPSTIFSSAATGATLQLQGSATDPANVGKLCIWSGAFIYSNTVPTVNQWSLVAVSLQPGANNSAFYINNVQDKVFTQTLGGFSQYGSALLYNPAVPSYFLNGYCAKLIVIPWAMKSYEISAVYDNKAFEWDRETNSSWNFSHPVTVEDMGMANNDNYISIYNMDYSNVAPGPGGSNGLYFNGSDEYGYKAVGTYSGMSPGTDDWSVCFWVNRRGNGAGDFPNIIGNRAWVNGTEDGWCISIGGSSSTGIVCTHFDDGTGAGGWDVATNQDNSTLTNGRWTHVCVVFARSRSEVIYYRDGVETQRHVGVTYPTGSVGSPSNMYIGRCNAGTRWFNGSLAKMKTFHRMLTTLEVKDIYSRESTGIL